MTDVQLLPLAALENNKGQIAGVPKNPRIIRDEQYKRLVASLQESDLTDYKPLLVYPTQKGKYVVLGGNMRLRALRELKVQRVSCIVIPTDTDVSVLKKAVIIDNNEFGEYDWDLIANEWSDEPLADWGVDLPVIEAESEDEEIAKEKDPEAEKLIRAAMVENIREFRRQIDVALANGFLVSGITRGRAKMHFIDALYYGAKYPQKMAFAYAPEMFSVIVGAGQGSYLTQMDKIISGKTEAGISGFITVTSPQWNLCDMVGNGYRVFGGCCSDFPSDVARKIYEENAQGGRVLDPCHGWGGRAIGAMLAGVKEYVGIDPSPIAHRAVSDIFSDFGGYVKTKVALLQKPYERVTDEELGGDFDLALTSPPYFDVEGYSGEETSTKLYPRYELWVEKFYKPLILNTMHRLKYGAAFFLQVGSQTYPLEKTAQEICSENGLQCEIWLKDMSFSILGTEDREGKENVLKITQL